MEKVHTTKVLYLSLLIRKNVPETTNFANEPFSSPVVSHKAKVIMEILWAIGSLAYS